jgi:hypothetical protein
LRPGDLKLEILPVLGSRCAPHIQLVIVDKSVASKTISICEMNDFQADLSSYLIQTRYLDSNLGATSNKCIPLAKSLYLNFLKCVMGTWWHMGNGVVVKMKVVQVRKHTAGAWSYVVMGN